MDTAQKNSWLAFVSMLIFIIIVSVIFLKWDASEIVEMIGVENGYAIMFLVSLFGGVSSIGGVAYFTTILTLSGGGLEPIFLALLSGAGVSVGDTLYFYFGKHGKKTLDRYRFRDIVERFTQWLDKKPRWFVPVSIFIYTGFTPLPNDILAVAMGATDRRYIPVISSLVLGNITLTYIVAVFGTALPFL